MEIKAMKAKRKDGRQMIVFKDAVTNDVLQVGFVRPMKDFIDEVIKKIMNVQYFLNQLQLEKEQNIILG